MIRSSEEAQNLVPAPTTMGDVVPDYTPTSYQSGKFLTQQRTENVVDAMRAIANVMAMNDRHATGTMGIHANLEKLRELESTALLAELAAPVEEVPDPIVLDVLPSSPQKPHSYNIADMLTMPSLFTRSFAAFGNFFWPSTSPPCVDDPTPELNPTTTPLSDDELVESPSSNDDDSKTLSNYESDDGTGSNFGSAKSDNDEESESIVSFVLVCLK